MPFDALYNEYLVRPLFNVLMWLYNTHAKENLGMAVVLFTLGLRVVLLPLSILSEASAMRFQKFLAHAHAVEKHFRKDKVALKTEMRVLMHRYRLKPWAKTVTLIIQGAVLVVLYRVFTVGIKNGVVVSSLYDWVDVPGRLELVFLGTNIGMRNVWWALAIGLIVFLKINYMDKHPGRDRRELWFGILFPLASFLALWWLPMVKSLFILTSIAFSFILKLLEMGVLKVFKKKPHATAGGGGHH